MSVTNLRLSGSIEGGIVEIGAQPPLEPEHISIIDNSLEFREIPPLEPFSEVRTPADGEPYMVFDLEKLQEALGDRLILQPIRLAEHLKDALREAGIEVELDKTLKEPDRRELMFGGKAWTTGKQA